MTAFKCDICGAYYEPYNHYGNQDCNKPNAIHLYNVNSGMNARVLERFDTCPECMEAFRKFVDSRYGVSGKAENDKDDS